VNDENEASLAHFSFEDGCTDENPGSAAAAAEDTDKFADENIELKKSMSPAKTESSELLNDSGNNEDRESAFEESGLPDVDGNSAERDGIAASAEMHSSPSRVDVNDVGDSHTVAEATGPNDSGPSCSHLTKVSWSI